MGCGLEIPIRSTESEPFSDGVERMIECTDALQKWKASNHLMLAFHSSDPERFSAIFRDQQYVGPMVTEFLRSQQQYLKDFAAMDTDDLLD